MEREILSGLIASDDYFRKILPFLERGYFSQQEAVIFDLITKFGNKYNKRPTKESLLIDLEDKKLKQETYDNIKSIIKALPEQLQSDVEWLIDKTETFCKDKAIYNAIMDSIHIIEGQDKEREKTIIPELLSEALSVSFDTAIGHDFLDDAEKRFDFYHQDSRKLPFDLEMLNKITKGGVEQKSLTIYMASTGVGKSIMLCHNAAAFLTMGKNVLYITLEMAEEMVAERIDANLMNIPLDNLRALDKESYMKKIERIRKKTPGKLKIKEWPEATVHVGHFRRLLRELKIKKNFVPDVILVDYINLMNSSRVKKGSTVNSYSYIQSIAQELRGFSKELGVPIFSATQVNRAGMNSSDIGLEDVADSVALSHTADLFLAMITSEEMEAQGQIMFKQLKNRFGTITENKRFLVGLDKAKMKFYDLEENAQRNIKKTEESVEKILKNNKKDFSGFDFG